MLSGKPGAESIATSIEEVISEHNLFFCASETIPGAVCDQNASGVGKLTGQVPS
jgi:hypothetical protein